MNGEREAPPDGGGPTSSVTMSGACRLPVCTLRRELHDFSRDVLFVTDREGNIVDVNVAGGAALGISVDLERREALLLCVAEADGPSVRRVLDTITSSASAELELHLRSASGRVVWAVRAKLAADVASILWSAAAVGDKEASTLRRLVRDKTEVLDRERRRAETAETASHAKDRLLAIVAEDSHAALHAVLGWTRMLRTELLGATARDHALGVIEGNVERHLKLIADLLDLGRVTDDDVQLDLQLVELDAIVDDVLMTETAAAAEAGVTLTRTRSGASEGAPTVVGDRRKLERLVAIVIDAFTGAASRGGRIDVTTQWEEDAFILRAAGRMGTAPSPRRATIGGAAAGAEIASVLVDRLARVHRGSAAWSVDADGRRTVEVRLPRAERPPPATMTREAPLGGLRVLVFEPDADTRALAMLQLRARGASVVGAREAAVAIAGLRGFRPDVVVANVTSALEGGAPLFEQIRADAGAAIVGLTASAAEVHHARVAGVDETVAAPFDRDALVGAVIRTATTRRASRVDEH